MIADKDIARQIGDSMFEIVGQIEASIKVVEQSCSAQELLAYKRAVGKVIYELYESLLEPLYKEHPNLRPGAHGTG